MAAIRLFGRNFCHASRGMDAEAMVTSLRERFGRAEPSIPTDRGEKPKYFSALVLSLRVQTAAPL